MRVLDARGIAYRVTAYDEAGAFHAAEEAAALVGAAPESVYKTLVVMREGDARSKPIMIMIASDTELDLKALARETGDKRLRMATQREAEQLTGMKAGGISALGLRKPSFEILIDERAGSLDDIHVSAGVRGVELALRVHDLVAATGARFVRLSEN
jgi:Cys-tRNA(Pro)/Cys-tRNA(Cys) deacylase